MANGKQEGEQQDARKTVIARRLVFASKTQVSGEASCLLWADIACKPPKLNLTQGPDTCNTISYTVCTLDHGQSEHLVEAMLLNNRRCCGNGDLPLSRRRRTSAAPGTDDDGDGDRVGPAEPIHRGTGTGIWTRICRRGPTHRRRRGTTKCPHGRCAARWRRKARRWHCQWPGQWRNSRRRKHRSCTLWHWQAADVAQRLDVAALARQSAADNTTTSRAPFGYSCGGHPVVDPENKCLRTAASLPACWHSRLPAGLHSCLPDLLIVRLPASLIACLLAWYSTDDHDRWRWRRRRRRRWRWR